MASNQAATKSDVEEIVGRVVGEIVGEAMQLISERFDNQDKEIAELKITTNRIENKLDATTDLVDLHSEQLNHLRAKTA